MNKEELAQLLHCRQYSNEITPEEDKQARKDGLLVIFGYSDDNAELRGLFHDEVGCNDGGTILIHSRGLLAIHDDQCDCPFCGYEAAAAKCAKIEAQWDSDGYSLTYKTDLPHATFDIWDGDQRYCRGIVIAEESLPIL